MEETIYSLLSGVASGRRWWVRAPQNINADTGPYVVLYRIDGVPSYHYQGRDLVQSRIQANCYGKTYADAKTAARAVISALEGQSSGSIQNIFVETDGRDLSSEDPSKNQVFVVAVDLNVIHSA